MLNNSNNNNDGSIDNSEGEDVDNKDHLYLIDGSGYIFRAYHALPPLSRADGTPVGAVLGFSNILSRFLQGQNGDDRPTHLAVVFDAGRQTFRNDIYPAYKATRPETPADLIPQFALIREATLAFNVMAIEQVGVEADDVIATLTRIACHQGMKVTIVSSDKDLMQLITQNVTMLDPVRGKRIDKADVLAKFGVTPDKVVEVQSLMGDSSDNVPGVHGIGPVGAARLINQFGSLDNLLNNLAEVTPEKTREKLIEHQELARISKQLVQLKSDVILPQSLASLAVEKPNPEILMAFLEQNGFRNLKKRLLDNYTPPLIKQEADLEQAIPIIDQKTIATRIYETIHDVASLKKYLTKITAVGFVSFDTETTSLDVMQAKLVGFSLCVEAGRAVYVPLIHQGETLNLTGKDITQIAMNDALPLLKELLEDSSILKIGHNIKYDAGILHKYNIKINTFDDTMLMSSVLHSGKHGHGMDALAKIYLAIDTIKYSDVTGIGKNKINFADVSIENATQYAAEDADITLQLYQLFKPQLRQMQQITVYETLERPLLPVLLAMEQAGIMVNPDMLSKLSADFMQRMAMLESKIYELAGHSFNLNSPKQLAVILFEEMKLLAGKKGKTGAYSTDADTLEKLASEGHEIAAQLLEWRGLAKLKSTYTDTLQQQIDVHTKRVHTSFSMAATITGRLSSSDPNIQNIPIRTPDGRSIRAAFIARAGYKLLSADYSQIELRILAHIANVQSLKRAFATGVDIHTATASDVFGVAIEGMDSAIRRQAKAINFGIIYGISAFGLAAQLAIPQSEAALYIKKYFERFPEIRDYMENSKEYARKHGFVTTIFGRRCHLAEINDKNHIRRSFMERVAINAPIQGSAADIIKRAMIKLALKLQESNLDITMLLQVHDELVFEVKICDIPDAKELIKQIMENAAMPAAFIDVPLTVDIGIADNWAKAH